MVLSFWMMIHTPTLLKLNSSPLKIRPPRKKMIIFQPFIFRGEHVVAPSGHMAYPNGSTNRAADFQQIRGPKTTHQNCGEPRNPGVPSSVPLRDNLRTPRLTSNESTSSEPKLHFLGQNLNFSRVYLKKTHILFFT